MSSACEKLDEYLLGDLPAESAARFERHLPGCDLCREAVAQQDWIDGLLTSPVQKELEAAPPSLNECVRRSISERRMRSQVAACGMAAAVLLMALGWLELNRQTRGLDGHGEVQAEVAPVYGPAVADATFVGGADVIAVPIESRRAEVTIVRIYPTYQPQNEDDAATTDPTDSNFTWHDYSNGG